MFLCDRILCYSFILSSVLNLPLLIWDLPTICSGPDPSNEQIKEFSNEMQVTDLTPPAFLVHAKDDNVVPYANSLVFAEALKNHHIPAKIFLYEQGGHGFGMTNKTSTQRWMDLCIEWISGLKPEN